jgi:beta-phosphoglucomutase-like phosphatase (HAD superfamily)
VIEDAPAGIQSARAAGTTVIGITSTYGVSALEQANAVIRKLGQIEVTVNGAGKLGVEVR